LTGNFATLAGRLREVAAAIDGREEIGDGFVARVCAEVQRRLWHPPLEHAAEPYQTICAGMP
jgi:hypothetical protein